MSNKTNDVVRVDYETEITKSTVSDLTRLANETIIAYNEVHPIYNALTKKILDTLQDDAVFDSLDNEELFKLIAITSKNQLAPIEQLTKLVTQLNALHDRVDANKEIEKLRGIVEELKSARDKDLEEAEVTISVSDLTDADFKVSELDEEVDGSYLDSTYEDFGGDVEVISGEPAEEQKVLTIDDLIKRAAK